MPTDPPLLAEAERPICYRAVFDKYPNDAEWAFIFETEQKAQEMLGISPGRVVPVQIHDAATVPSLLALCREQQATIDALNSRKENQC